MSKESLRLRDFEPKPPSNRELNISLASELNPKIRPLPHPETPDPKAFSPDPTKKLENPNPQS